MIHDLTLLGDNLCVGPPAPRTDIDFLKARIMCGFMPVRTNLFGDDRERLKRTTRWRRIEPQRLPRAQEFRERRAHRIGLCKARARQRRILRRALHTAGGVENRFAVPRDEDTSVKLHEHSNALKLPTSQALRRAAILFMKDTGIARFRRYIAISFKIKRKPQGSMV